MILSGNIQVVTTTTRDFGYIVWHKAILFNHKGKQRVLHMTFSGLEVTTLENLMKRRKELYRTAYTLKDKVNTQDILNDPRFKKFNLITNNCECFINTFLDEHTTLHIPHISQQSLFWISLITILYIYKHRY